MMMRRLWAFLLLFALLLFAAGLSEVTAVDDTLFIERGPARTSSQPGVEQTRPVAVNWAALKNGRSRTIHINLFNNQEITAVRDRRDPSSAAGGYVWVGHIQDEPHSAVTLSVVDNVLVGSIVMQGSERYTIKYQDGAQVLHQIDPSEQILVEGPDTVAVHLPAQETTQRAVLCEDGSRVDLLVAYTGDARDQEGGTAAIEALINQRVADMNTANSSSGLGFTYDLVHVMHTYYPETGNVQVDLPRLRNPGDGYLDDIAAARDTYRADLVSLLIAQSTTNNACGVGYVMGTLSTSFAYSAVNVTALDYIGPQYYCSPLTMAHEFGHNMGNLHNREDNSLNPALPYAYGYRPYSYNFRTIMSYNCPGGCPQINYWSNPDVSYNGEATGIDHDLYPSQSADNARSMAQTAYYVSNFRENCAAAPTNTPTPTNTPLPTNTPSPTNTASPSNTPTFTPTATNSPTPTPSQTPRPSDTPPPEPSATPTASRTAAPTSTSTPTATKVVVFDPANKFYIALLLRQ